MHSFEQDPTRHEIQHRLDHAERTRLALDAEPAPRGSVHAALRGFLKPLRRR